MKKAMYLLILVGVFVAFAAGPAEPKLEDKPAALPSTVTVYLDDLNYCNDYTLVCSMLASKIYEAHGWESGCLSNDTTVTGSIHIAGGYAYFGVEKLMGFWPSALGLDFVTIDLSTKSGSGWWWYHYDSGSGTTVNYGAAAPYDLVVLGMTADAPAERIGGPDNRKK